MRQHFHIGLLVLTVAALVTLFFYRTPSAVQRANTGEFGGVSLRIEYATTSAARERGLAGRTSIPGDYGMLFVFPEDGRYGFWMKDMLVPVDMFWLDAQGQVVFIASEVATSTFPNVFYPNLPARYVLEIASGFAREHSIATGTPLLLKNLKGVSE
ncbi:MAG: DUF192 domain-containing protein [Candidatus Paceibacterota bacterium]|jgi:hypothetical protein